MRSALSSFGEISFLAYDKVYFIFQRFSISLKVNRNCLSRIFHGQDLNYGYGFRIDRYFRSRERITGMAQNKRCETQWKALKNVLIENLAVLCWDIETKIVSFPAVSDLFSRRTLYSSETVNLPYNSTPIVFYHSKSLS